MERPNTATGLGPDALRRALEVSEARFRNIIEKNADGLIVVRPDGSICFVNPAATRLMGYPVDMLIGVNFGIPILPGETTEIDIPVRDGEMRVAELRVVETEWDGEQALLISLRDVTEHRRLEEALRRTAEELAEADRRKDEFLAMLAHELRNPLAPILNATHLMRLRGDDPGTLQRMRDMVERQVRSMARLVDDLLDVSRITRGKIQLRKEPVNLAAVIQRAVETTKPLFQASSQDLAMTLPEGTIRVHADPLRLEQIVINLLNNASKYSEFGAPVQLIATREDQEVLLRVVDRGIGIAPEMLAQVFELFAQADRSLDRAQGGLGIGLTLVRSLVQMHGGTVTCRSDGLGKGSEFSLRLPILLTDLDDDPEPVPEPVKTEGVSRRVLVIDDNVHAAESLALIIKLWGHEVRLAYNGPDALETAVRFLPDVVLLDIGLPGMDGFTVARHLRDNPAFRDLLLMAITGYGREDDRQRSIEAGFDRHLVKPLDLDLLEGLLSDPSSVRIRESDGTPAFDQGV
ncbi:hybrid sensor histidine kinase/response regulator [Singulisphaera rosea]